MTGEAVEFSEVVKRRHSVRRFEDRPVEREKLEYVLEAGRLAPSTSNRQSASFVVVQDGATIAKVGRPYAMYNKWLPAAPALIVATGDKIKAMSHHGVHFWEVDAAIACEHMALAAVDVGLGACWVGLFHQSAVRRALRIPPHMRILALLALGYPVDGESAERLHNRKPLDEFAHWEAW